MEDRNRWKKLLLVLGILLIITVTVIVWQLDVDWKEQIRVYGYFGVFVLSLVTSATIIFPLPGDVALFAAPGIMKLSWLGVFWLGLIASIGAAIGELTAYYAGRWGRSVVARKDAGHYKQTASRLKRYGGLTIFVFALTPLPFDIVGVAAGSLRFPVVEFFIYCWAGRLVRSMVVVYAGWYGWESVKQMFF